MIRRVPPPRYQTSEGRLVDYAVEFVASERMPTNIWSFHLNKTYIPWSTWDAYCSEGPARLPSTPPRLIHGTYALKPLAKEHERTLEDVTVRLRRETRIVEQEGWTFSAYQRHFRYLSPAAIDAFSDIMPWLEDPGAYHWDTIKGILVAYTGAAALDYGRLADPGYFEQRRLVAMNLWQMLDCVAQTMAAKWELAFGECQGNPDPDDFRLPNTDQAVEIGGWMLSRFPSLRDGELPMPLSRFVELHRVELQPQQGLANLNMLAERFGDAATPDLFGQVWAERFGYEALLADLETTLTTPQALIALGWLYPQRLMR